jgi:hypothetical protein
MRVILGEWRRKKLRPCWSLVVMTSEPREQATWSLVRWWTLTMPTQKCCLYLVYEYFSKIPRARSAKLTAMLLSLVWHWVLGCVVVRQFDSYTQGRIYARATGARAQGGKFPGGILKKWRLKYGMRIKRGCPQERNLREIYTENTIIFCFLSVFYVVFAYT